MEEFVGQKAIVGAGKLLRRAIQGDRLTSAIFWGPPGSGKSTLAGIIARTSQANFESLSAVASGVVEARKVIERAGIRRASGQRTILFIDEIHRWNKAQQDALLPNVEDGSIILIGATTENPYFEVNAPLISRSRIFRFERLTDDDLRELLKRALMDTERGLGKLDVTVEESALDHMVDYASGDARNALNALETAVQQVQDEAVPEMRVVTLTVAEDAIQQRALRYDKKSDEHYDTISAFIKSVRGSDPDAALYWLAKMLLAGEDPKFIARRIVILASEDIGNADPMGLVIANAAAQAVMFIGMPEAQLTLSQAVIYLACASKSNSATVAIGKAMQEIKQNGPKPVPEHLRDAHYPGARKLGHGKGYLYPHDFPGHHVKQSYLPDEYTGEMFYTPGEEGHEAKMKARVENRKRGL